MTIDFKNLPPRVVQLALESAGCSLVSIDNVLHALPNEETVQAALDNYDPLPPARAIKWEKIKTERDRRKHAGFMVQGNRFHSDPDSRIQQLGLVMMGANIPEGLQWKVIGDAFVTMTPQLAGAIFQATAQADAALFASAEAKRASINSMVSLQEIEDFDHLANWPDV